jgi:hypothetical protein
MNSLMKQHYPLFDLYRSLRDQLMDALEDRDLAFSLPGSPALGALCVEIGEVQTAYIQSFQTLNLDFSSRQPDPALATSVVKLRRWYAELDRALRQVLEAKSEAEVQEQIVDRGGDFKVPLFVQLEIYKEALLIFYGKADVYLKALGRPRSEQWAHWIG